MGELLHDAGLSWLHFVFAFILVGALMAEAFILRLPVDHRVARLLLRVDLFYGLAAVLVIVAGVARVAWGAAGWDYYRVQPFFWAKMATLFVIAVASALPTLTFVSWAKKFAADPNFTPAPGQVRRVRLFVLAEAHLVALLLLFAALMARGIGQG